MKPSLLYVFRLPYNSEDEIRLLRFLKNHFNVFVCILDLNQDFETQKRLLEEEKLTYFTFSRFSPKGIFHKVLYAAGLEVAIQNFMEMNWVKNLHLMYNFKVVLSPVETQPVTRAFAVLKRKLNVKVVTLQRTQNNYTPPWLSWLKEHETAKKPSMFFQWNKLVEKLVGLQFDGKHDRFLVAGKGSFEIYQTEGIDPGVMRVVGHLENDYLYDFLQLPPQEKENELASIRKRLNFAEERIILINLSPPHLIRDKKLKECQTNLVKSVLRKIKQEDRIVLVVHPRSKGEEFDQSILDLDPRLIMSPGIRYIELFKICSHYICNLSTTTFDFICLGKPLLTVNLSRNYIGDLNENISGGFHVRYEDELDEILPKFLDDTNFQTQLLFQQKFSQKRWVVFDGKVKSRIKDELLLLLKEQ